MRVFAIASILATALAVVSAGSAWACIPPPPPHWPSLRVEGGPTMIIGHVLSVTRADAPVRTEYFEIWNETAVIAPIETVQGTARAEYAVTAVGDVSELKPGPMFCADRMTLKPGEIVFGYEGRNGALQILEPYALPTDLRARLETYP